jgi:hypothetical protein
MAVSVPLGASPGALKSFTKALEKNVLYKTLHKQLGSRSILIPIQKKPWYGFGFNKNGHTKLKLVPIIRFQRRAGAYVNFDADPDLGLPKWC